MTLPRNFKALTPKKSEKNCCLKHKKIKLLYLAKKNIIAKNLIW